MSVNFFWNTFMKDRTLRLNYRNGRYQPASQHDGTALFKMNCPRYFTDKEYDAVLEKFGEIDFSIETTYENEE